ncbi:MAG TPA: PadR family transcriptional regulator [Candidatus Izemoplasmatales bacterium]|nr:PadR family transcriptional regulator [Bacillota bacterium]HRY78245.1 PadR family transcriptional regulator [Candidatus Izemoplasmatales bacterium]
MINSEIIRGHIDAIILKLLMERDKYGYELASEIKNRSQDLFPIKEATLYSAVTRLESRELISSYVGEKTHGGKRRYYKITPFGRAYYAELLKEWRQLRQIMTALLGSDGE